MQFNWLFVLVVGAIILAFFFTLITSQQKKATVEESYDLVYRLDTIFVSLGKQPSTVDEFPIPNVKLNFLCEDGLSNYYIQDTGPVGTPYDPIFTVNLLEGNKIIVWTELWKVPYEVGTLTFLTNDRTLFVFVYNDPQTPAGELHSLFPEAITVDQLGLDDVSSYNPKGFSRIVYIINENDRSGITFPEETSPISYVRSFDPAADSTDVVGYGTVHFIHVGNDESSTYADVPTALGAIFSEDKSFYVCNMNKVFLRLSIITDILKRRSDALSQEMSESLCFSNLVAAKTDFQEISTLAQSFDDTALAHLTDKKEDLEQLASDVLRGYTCPVVY